MKRRGSQSGRGFVTAGRRGTTAMLLAAALAWLCGVPAVHGYIRTSYSLGRITAESTIITIAKVSEVDRGRNVITYRKVRDLRGSYPAETIRHNIGKNGEFSTQGQGRPGTYIGESARDWRDIMEWVNVGKEVVFFWNGGPCEVCIGTYWYQVVPEGGDWRLLHSEPTFALAFAGRVPTLITAVQAMVAGQEVVVPALVQDEVGALLERRAKPHRMKASLKLTDYNPQRDFVGWGGDGEELRPLSGMPGFSYYGALATLGRGGVTGLAPACFQGDDKPGVCLFNEQRVILLAPREGFLAETPPLPVQGGARSAAWSDCNGDGRPDLLLAMPSGLNLLMNLGSNKFVCSSNLLPQVAYPHVLAAAWIRAAPAARPDIVLADGFRGLRFYRNRTDAVPPAAAGTASNAPPAFEDLSERVGLGEAGAAGSLPCHHLLVADLNGDGSEDLLIGGATNGVVLVQTAQGFREVAAAGLAYGPRGVQPAFGDFNGDGRPDLFVPQGAAPGRLFLNIGNGRFKDVTAQSGDLAQAMGMATCAVWSDFCKRGREDLLVGCLGGPNRYFRNRGDGTFAAAGRELGLTDAIYNSTSLAVQDINQDGVPDLVMGNVAGESAVLLGRRDRLAAAETGDAGKNPSAGKEEAAHASRAK